ncbi:MAG: hypothetical protein VYC15_00305 [Pseudomonadota bacterium]|nr:hypothetical protein [Pseudomonadota bacterium]
MLNYLLIIFLALVSIGCSKKENSYFPLNAGLKWQYNVALTTRDGLEKQKYILQNIGLGELNSEPVFLRESLDGTILYYSLSEEGIYYLGNSDSKLLDPKFYSDRQIVIPKNLTVGAKWNQSTITKLLKKTGPPQKTEFKIIADVPLDLRIESLDDTITVPAGQFSKCMRIKMTGSAYKNAGNYVGLTLVNVEQTNWYSPGVGLVKLERLETTQSAALDKGTLSIELVNFESK